MKPFDIGPGVTCDLDVLLNTRLLIQANSGAGKSWALRRLLEQTHGQVQQLILDPEGEFVTLRERFDVVVAARTGGDTLAEPRTAALLAERLLELGVSAVLDIYELKAHERVAFVQRFLEALVDAPKKLWHPALVVLDEAHVYAPEKGSAESLQAVIDLATRGRKRGYCLVQATQRLSKLHKDAAAEMNNKLIGRSALDVDMERAGDELGLSKADRRQLRDLDAGEFYAFGPALTRTVTRVKVAGVETRHPKAGSKLSGVVPPPTGRVKSVLAKLADLPAEAEQRQQTEAQLRARVVELERELKTRINGEVLTAAAPTKAVDVLTDADRALLKSLADVGDAIRRQWGNAAQTLVHYLHPVMNEMADRVGDAAFKVAERDAVRLGKALDSSGMKRIVEKLDRVSVAPLLPGPPTPVRVTVSATRTAEGKVRPGWAGKGLPAPLDGATDLSESERRVLASLAWWATGNIDSPTRHQVAFAARYTVNGHFNNTLGGLRTRGLLDYPSKGTVSLTEAGHRAVSGQLEAAEVLSRDTLIDRAASVLRQEPQARLFQIVSRASGPMTREALAAAANYTVNGHFNNTLGALRSLGLIDYPSKGMVCLGDMFNVRA